MRRLSASSIAAPTQFPPNAGMWSRLADASVLLGMLLRAASTARSMRHNWKVCGRQIGGKSSAVWILAWLRQHQTEHSRSKDTARLSRVAWPSVDPHVALCTTAAASLYNMLGQRIKLCDRAHDIMMTGLTPPCHFLEACEIHMLQLRSQMYIDLFGLDSTGCRLQAACAPQQV